MAIDRKQLKQSRIRGYFIDAACEIIENEGLSEASVRKIAEKAGYNYRTLYLHFDDASHVIHMAILKFLDRIGEYIDAAIADIEDTKDRYVAAMEAYCRFLMEHPNIARCVLVERTGELPEDLKDAVIHNPLARRQAEYIKDCVITGVLKAETAKDTAAMLLFVSTGSVIQFMNGRTGHDSEETLRITRTALLTILSAK